MRHVDTNIMKMLKRLCILSGAGWVAQVDGLGLFILLTRKDGQTLSCFDCANVVREPHEAGHHKSIG